MTWVLPFLFIHFIVQAGGPLGLANVPLRSLLACVLGCLWLFLIGVATRRYVFPSYRARMAQTYRGGS
jgi:hypothetical protein